MEKPQKKDGDLNMKELVICFFYNQHIVIRIPEEHVKRYTDELETAMREVIEKKVSRLIKLSSLDGAYGFRTDVIAAFYYRNFHEPSKEQLEIQRKHADAAQKMTGLMEKFIKQESEGDEWKHNEDE